MRMALPALRWRPLGAMARPGSPAGSGSGPFGALPRRRRPAVALAPAWGEEYAGPRGSRPLFDESRALREASALLRDPIWRAQGMAPGGHRPVMLIPGFSAGDASMAAFARWLRRAGYAAMASQVRLNVGCFRGTADHLTTRLEMAALRHDAPILLIGQSLGGVFARTLAMRRPDLVAGVVTLGSPHRRLRRAKREPRGTSARGFRAD